MAQRSPAPPAATPVRRTNGKRSVPLSKSEIVAAALEILDDVGVEGLTIRALSDRLGVALGATYKYVANKRVLIELVAAELFSRIEDTDVDGTDWQGRLNALFLRIYETFRVYPGLAWQITHLPMPSGRLPDIYNTLVEVLQGAGFSDPTVQSLIQALMYYTTGGVLVAAPEDVGDPLTSFAAGLDFLLSGANDRLQRELAAPLVAGARRR